MSLHFPRFRTRYDGDIFGRCPPLFHDGSTKAYHIIKHSHYPYKTYIYIINRLWSNKPASPAELQSKPHKPQKPQAKPQQE